MLSSFITALVDASRRFAVFVVIAALALSVVFGVYVARNITINTDINQLLSESLDWRKREKTLESAFPQKVDTLVIVIDGISADQTEKAAAALADRLATMTETFTLVSRPDALPYFRANGLLLLPMTELGGILDQVAQAQPMLGTLVADPSLRGFFGTIGLMMQGAQAGATDPAQLAQPLTAISDTVDAVNAGRDLPLDWQKMMPGAPSDARQLRKFILTKPILDYTALQPGEKATQAVRQAIDALGLSQDRTLHIRLTGSVPLNDQEFSSVAEGAGVATGLSALLVLGLLFMAMRSWRIVAPIAVTLAVGLIVATAFATAAVGSLNLISVAFAVMFIGIAVDFGIQFGIRYRDQRYHEFDHAAALNKTARVIAVPLAMAAGSTALGFLSFIPTDYRGVSELGLIAGAGMMIAFVLNITLLPALMTLIKTPPEKEAVGYAALKPCNDFLYRHRKILLPVIVAITLAGLAVASQVRFDFDPLDLKDPASESVATMLDAMQDPDSDAYAAQILMPSLAEARKLAGDLEKLPEVDHTMTVASFVPDDQDKKLAMIADTGAILAPTFALPVQPAPGDTENIEALRKAAALLHQGGDKMPAAQKLADGLNALVAQGSTALLKRAQDNIVAPMLIKMGEIRRILQMRPVTIDDVPDALKQDWVTRDGRYLVEIFPKRGADGNPRDPEILNRFIDAVRQVAPGISGTPVSMHESGRTVVSAFVQAGIYGVLSIGLLSFVIMRRWRDVGLMIAPLLIAGILTLATITLLGMRLNFANIIALPLLLSLGVSYAVYFVTYARQGQTDLLSSSMARAVLFSAGTVLVAFISLCFSSHPGTRGMGELLTISLLYCLVCTFVMLPVFLGFHRKDRQL